MDQSIERTKEMLSLAEYVKAAQFGDLGTIREACENNGLNPSTLDNDGCSLLHWSAINNRFDIVTYLLRLGADVDLPGGILQETPLMWAIRSGNNPKLIQLFIEKGANIGHVNIEGVDPLQLACRFGHATVCFMLLHNGANPDSFDNLRNNSLLWLLKNSSSSQQIILLLLKFGISIQHKDENDDTALHITARKVKRHSNTVDLHIMLKMYLGHGADLALKTENNEGKTPYQVAERQARNPASMRFFWDAWMFKNLPYYTPSFFMFMCVVLFFYFVSVYRWYGLLAWLIFIFVPANQLAQPTIVDEDARASFGGLVGILVSVLIAYHQYISHHASHAANTVMNVLAMISCILFVLILRSRPVYLQSGTQAERAAVLDKLVQASKETGHDELTIGSEYPSGTLCPVSSTCSPSPS